MNIFILAILSVLFFIIELVYFQIADKYNIIDKPNHRSSHSKVTIRGGGIIFSGAIFTGAVYCGFQYIYFLAGLFIISLISFIDDINPITNRIRIICHLIAVSLLFYQLNILQLPYYWILITFTFVIGTINAINFMDGINGITGLYGLVTLLTLYYINQNIVLYTQEIYLVCSILSLSVFTYFNFRKKAICFAGDVGSVGLAFIILFFFLQIIVTTYNFKYLLIFIVYGVDVVTTIFFRLCRKENIFDAHRTHFYQFLANEKAIPHLWVAVIYAFLQLLINYFVVFFLTPSTLTLVLSILFITLLFMSIRLYLEGIKRLFRSYQNN